MQAAAETLRRISSVDMFAPGPPGPPAQRRGLGNKGFLEQLSAGAEDMIKLHPLEDDTLLSNLELRFLLLLPLCL